VLRDEVGQHSKVRGAFSPSESNAAATSAGLGGAPSAADADAISSAAATAAYLMRDAIHGNQWQAAATAAYLMRDAIHGNQWQSADPWPMRVAL
jgi:hypothetical protein